MPRALSDAVRALIADDVVRPVMCVALILDSGAVYANTSPIDIQIAGATYLGVGLLGKISAVEESTETQAHNLALEMSGIPRELISLALQEKYQGRACRVFVAYLDRDWRMPEGAYKDLFAGRINTMSIELAATATIKITAEGRLADFDRLRGGRYTDEEQQKRFPGDRGLEFVPRMVEAELPWGAGVNSTAAPVVVQGGGGGKK
jgi:hypothetical protein